MSAQHPADGFDVGRIVNDLFTTHLPKATRQMPDERVTHDQLRQRHDHNSGGRTYLAVSHEFPFQKHRHHFHLSRADQSVRRAGGNQPHARSLDFHVAPIAVGRFPPQRDRGFVQNS